MEWRPTKPTRGPPPPPTSVRLRPDRPRQPELIRQLEERNPQPPLLAGHSEYWSAPTLKSYQLKPKRRKEALPTPEVETFIEPPMEWKESPSTNPKKLKHMKKKLDELNRKIRHSKKKNNELIHKQNSLRKAVEDLKHDTKPESVPEPEWTFTEHEQAFRGASRSYRVNGRPKMDVGTFFSQIREKLIDLIK